MQLDTWTMMEPEDVLINDVPVSAFLGKLEPVFLQFHKSILFILTKPVFELVESVHLQLAGVKTVPVDYLRLLSLKMSGGLVDVSEDNLKLVLMCINPDSGDQIKMHFGTSTSDPSVFTDGRFEISNLYMKEN